MRGVKHIRVTKYMHELNLTGNAAIEYAKKKHKNDASG